MKYETKHRHRNQRAKPGSYAQFAELTSVQEETGAPTADLLTQRMQIHEKTAGMLRSMISVSLGEYHAVSSGNIADDMIQAYIEEQEGEPVHDDSRFQIDSL